MRKVYSILFELLVNRFSWTMSSSVIQLQLYAGKNKRYLFNIIFEFYGYFGRKKKKIRRI